jgi:hypothetical protein
MPLCCRYVGGYTNVWLHLGHSVAHMAQAGVIYMSLLLVWHSAYLPQCDISATQKGAPFDSGAPYLTDPLPPVD